MKQTIKKIGLRLRENRWGLGLIEGGRRSVLDGDWRVKWIDTVYDDRWFADPFILDADSRTVTLLVEEFSYDIRRGRIARLVIDRGLMKVVDMKIILDSDTHLSFPFIFRRNGLTYVMPENSRSGSLYIYRYDGEALVDKVKVIDRPLADAIIVELAGGFYLLSTEEPDANGSTYHVFEFDPETLQAGQRLGSFGSDGRTARNAGGVFSYDGRIYRPAQKFGRRYGEAIVVQRIDPARGLSGFVHHGLMDAVKPFPIGLHTLNFHDDLAVVDGNAFRFPVIGPALDALSFMKRRIGGKV